MLETASGASREVGHKLQLLLDVLGPGERQQGGDRTLVLDGRGRCTPWEPSTPSPRNLTLGLEWQRINFGTSDVVMLKTTSSGIPYREVEGGPTAWMA